jgi:KDO2-lipid IV(A) lauroyltransferase
MAKSWRARSYLAPRYWPTWALLGFMRLSATLPYGWLLTAGKLFGWASFRLLKYRRYIAQTNIDLCFPGLTPEQRKALCKTCFQNIGTSIFETALAWWGNPDKLKRLYQIEGLEHIKRAQAENKPIILLSGHMSCTDIGATLLAFHLPFQAMYKPAKNALFEAVMQERRSNTYYEMVPRKQSRRLLKNLKNNIATWYGPDQTFGREETVFAPFFGVPTATLTATSRIAKFAHAVVIPFFPYRLPKQQGYRLVLGTPLENFPGDSLLEDATVVNKVIEDGVRVAPGQYLWLHKRFRLRPHGEPELY